MRKYGCQQAIIRRPLSRLFNVVLACLLLYAFINFFTGYKCDLFAWIESNIPNTNLFGYATGIAAVITALGAVSFSLSYINSARLVREKGILMEEVLADRYPCYGLIFAYHGGFALLGLYSCAANAIHTSWVCLGGLILSTAYSVHMAYCINFGMRGRKRMINHYIEDLLREIQPFLKQIRDTGDNIDLSARTKEWATYDKCRKTAYQLGRYIGEQYQADGLEYAKFINSQKKGTKKNIFVSMLQLLIVGDWSTEEWEGSLPEAFDKLFAVDVDKQSSDKVVPVEYALYDLIGIDEKFFEENVKHCALLWGNLLTPIKQDIRQAELIVAVLRDSPLTSALCCGLVCYLYNTYVQEQGEKGWMSCARMIQYIANVARNENKVHEPTEKPKAKVLRCCMDMLLVYFWLACLVEVNSDGPWIDWIFSEQFNQEQRRNSSDTCHIVEEEQCMLRYLYYAKKIFHILAIPEANLPNRAELCHQIPYLITMAKLCFSQETINMK